MIRIRVLNPDRSPSYWDLPALLGPFAVLLFALVAATWIGIT